MRLRKIFAAALLLLSVGNAMAQMPPIPVDKNVKIGHLDNGLTYYIRHNAFPEHVASFYIAQKVGCMRPVVLHIHPVPEPRESGSSRKCDPTPEEAPY